MIKTRVTVVDTMISPPYGCRGSRDTVSSKNLGRAHLTGWGVGLWAAGPAVRTVDGLEPLPAPLVHARVDLPLDIVGVLLVCGGEERPCTAIACHTMWGHIGSWDMRDTKARLPREVIKQMSARR